METISHVTRVLSKQFDAASSAPEINSSTIELGPTEGQVLQRHEVAELGALDSSTDFQDEDKDLEFPEGGWMAWRVTLGSFFGLFVVLGIINAVGAIQAYVEENQLADLPTSTVAWIFSINTFMTYFFSIQCGQLFDMYGPYPLLAVGSFLIVLGFMLTSLCEEFWQFVVCFGVVCGLGSSICLTPAVAIIGDWFKAKRGTATGAATIGGSLGGAVIPIMLRSMYSSVGYGWAVRTLGFLSLACMVICIWLVKPRFERSHEKNGRTFWQLYVTDVLDFRCLKDKRFAALCFAATFSEIALLISLTFFTSFCLKSGMSQNYSYILLTIMNAVGMVGRYLPAWISDRLGRFNTMIIMTLGASLAMWIMWLPFGTHRGALTAFAVVYGFFTGSILSLIPVCCGQISKTSEYGRRYGVMNFFIAFGALGGVPISGALIFGTNYDYLIIFNAILSTIGCLGWIIARTACVKFTLCRV